MYKGTVFLNGLPIRKQKNHTTQITKTNFYERRIQSPAPGR